MMLQQYRHGVLQEIGITIVEGDNQSGMEVSWLLQSLKRLLQRNDREVRLGQELHLVREGWGEIQKGSAGHTATL